MTREETITREEAIRRIKAWNLDSDDMEVLAAAIPELAESEDEKIRKRLIEYFEGFRMGNVEVRWEGLIVQEVLAWLEKQKERVVDSSKTSADEDERIREAIESTIRVYGKTQGEWIGGYDMDTLVVHLREAFSTLEKQKEQKPKQVPKWLYRLEFKDNSCGLWYNGQGEWCFENGIGSLDDSCKTKNLPMDYDERYKQDGRNWFSSCSKKEDLLHWYSKEDAKTLLNKGFVFTRYLATEYHEYDQQTVFIKETALYREEINFLELMKEQKPEQYDIDVLEKHITKDSISELAHTVIVRNGWEIVEKEQKPVDFPTTDEEVKEFLETRPKVAVPEKYKTPDFVFSKQEYESHPIISKDTTSVKPAEWSEEDADILNCCISSIEEAKENRYAYKETDGDTSYDREIDWLKSLRPQPQTKTNDYITPHKKFFQWIYNRLVDVHGENPNVDYMQSFKKRIDNLQFSESHWKPSEEQMDALRASNSYWKGTTNEVPRTDLLESLYNDLEKLIAKR